MLERIDHDGILELNMARPPVNALSPDYVRLLIEALTTAPREGAQAIVLSGRPGLFSAGLDVPALLALDEPAIYEFWKDFINLLGAIACSPIPVAAAITGNSPAGGAVMSIYCDYRVMAEGDYRIGVNEVQVGLPLPPIVHAALVRQVGPRHAERLGAGGLLLAPEDALAVGLVDRITPVDQVVPCALAWCRHMVELPPDAMRMTRDMVRADLVELFKHIGENDYRMMTDAWYGAETQATMRALVERLKQKKK